MIPDNYDLWERYERENEARLGRLPLCEKCKKRIQDEFYFYIEGEILCEECMQDKYMFNTEDYME